MPTGPLLVPLTLLLAALAAALAGARRGFAGLLVMGLAFAGLVRAGGPEWAQAGLSRTTLGISAGLLVAGLGVVAWTARGQRVAAGAAGAAALAGLGTLVPLVREGGVLIPAGTVALLLGGARLLGLLGSALRIGPGVRRLEELLGGAGPLPDPQGPRATTLLSVHAALALATLVVPHLHLLLLAVAGAGITGVQFQRRIPGIGALLWAGLLGFSWWYLIRVAGATPLGLAALREGPFSPAFEVTAALPVALAAWPLLGLWPFHRSGLGPFAPLAGGALLVRLLAPALPNGLIHWQPLLYLLVALAAWHAMWLRRATASVAALAALGLLAGVPAAGWAGIGLLAGAALSGLGELFQAAGREPGPRAAGAAWMLAAGGSLLLVPVIGAGLATEALYTVLAIAGVVAGAWQQGTPDARGASHGADPGHRAPAV